MIDAGRGRALLHFAAMDATESPQVLPDYLQVEDDLLRLALGVGASELHGLLCGYVCGGATVGADWLQCLLPDTDAPLAPAEGPLAQLLSATGQQLAGDDMALGLLLPDDDQPVDERAEALLDWCRGFLGGFGLSGRSLDTLIEDAQEALADIGHIATSRIDYGNHEEDDNALAEIVEYVRVAVQFLFEECARPTITSRTLH